MPGICVQYSGLTPQLPQLSALADNEDELDLLLLHISADSCASAGTGDADLHGGALSAGRPAEGEQSQDEGLHQGLVTWLDDVVKGVNALPGPRDSLLLVLLLSAVRSQALSC
jgi:hypothetical protein